MHMDALQENISLEMHFPVDIGNFKHALQIYTTLVQSMNVESM